MGDDVSALGPQTGSLVIEEAEALYLSSDHPPLRNGWVLVADGQVIATGEGAAPAAETALDASGMIVLPGLICAHHHLFQGLSRGVITERPDLLSWLERHYSAWAFLNEAHVRAAAELSLAQLLRGGCTAVAAHEYLHPPGEDFATPVIEAAGELGIRLLYVRGTAPTLEDSMQDRLAARGVPVDRLVEEPNRAFTAMHDLLANRPTSAALRFALGPTTPVEADDGAFHAAIDEIARAHGAHLHLHLHPISGRTDPMAGFAYAQALGLVAEGNWFAHGSRLEPADVTALGAAGVGVVHCPSSSHLLNYQLPELQKWAECNDRVCVGVDGAASNDGGCLLHELALTYYSQLHRWGRALAPSLLLDLVTRRAARALSWPELGTIRLGAPADISAFRLDGPDSAGLVPGQGNPFAQLLRTYRGEPAALTLVGGRVVVTDGQLTTASLPAITANARRLAAKSAKWYDGDPRPDTPGTR
jgi:8-oxoguanine deaminase